MSRERAAKTLHGINKERRQLITWGAIGIAAVTGEVALTPVRKAYAAVATAANFRDRRNRISPTHSAALDAPATTLDISQGQLGTIQDTPTPNATVTALQKKQLELQVRQLETQPSWFEKYVVPSLAPAIALGTTIGTLSWGIVQFSRNQRIDREKRDEDRFQTIVSGLGNKDIATRTGAAVLLHIFLDSKHKEFYRRYYDLIFKLAVRHLRLRHVNPHNPEPDEFYKEMIRIFIKSAPLVVEKLREKEKVDFEALAKSNIFDMENYTKFKVIQLKYLDASKVHLEGALLIGGDDPQKIDADLRYIYLSGAFFNNAQLVAVNLRGADLEGAHFDEADLNAVYLNGANLLDANPEDAHSLSAVFMYDVENYPDRQKRQRCEDKGAMIFVPPLAEPDTKGETK